MRRLCLLLSLALLLSGCGGAAPVETEASVPETTQAAVFRFPDGDPETAACLGSYTAQSVTDAVVALVDEVELTNRELQAWYWAEVASYCQSGGQGLDMDTPLDQQVCAIDDSVLSWQQYFLKQALNTWHTAQALIRQGQLEGVPSSEPTYAPIKGNYEKYMTGMPATKVLEGYEKSFQPNSMHQAYLDGLPQTLSTLAKELGYASAEEMARKTLGTGEEQMLAFAQSYNLAYMYLTSLSYLLEPDAEAVASSGEALVTFRHILFTGDDAWERAWQMQTAWEKDWLSSESRFASQAFQDSQDQGSAGRGGLYRRVSQDQLPQELALWCFDQARVPEETGVVETAQGVHVVYFVASEDRAAVRAEQELLGQQEQALLQSARETYPMTVSYADIVLTEAEGKLSKDALLYPDLAHERFPDVPLYLQQDYPGVMYGAYPLRSNGCGITSFAMLASYMADEALSPPYMCENFGRYSSVSGTDSDLFRKEGGAFNCYQIYNTYDWKEAREYVKQGYPTIVLQHKGYWTRGGHYLVLEKMDEDGMVQVRDSNLFNYMRIRDGHLTDRFSWDDIWPASSGYWVFAKKDVTTGACTRCGTEEGRGLCQDYLCQKCEEALLRRNTYLNG